MKVLAIGNSFSQDATRYVHQIARAGHFDLDVINLFIPGCPLSYHYSNTLSNEKMYELEFNGRSTGFHVSIQDALSTGGIIGFDVVTVQQVSRFSFQPESYHPYLEGLSDFIRTYAPKSKLMIHQTWAYLHNSARLAEAHFETPEMMFDAVKSAYDQAAASISSDGIIPSGASFRAMMKEGIYDLHRDDIHASLGFGRYILGLTWYEALTGNSCIGNSFRDFDEPISDEHIFLAQRIAHGVVQSYQSNQ